MEQEEKTSIQNRIEKFLAAGNPPSFLKRIGVLGFNGEINFDRAKEIMDMVAENEEEILGTLEAAGYEARKRNNNADESFIVD